MYSGYFQDFGEIRSDIKKASVKSAMEQEIAQVMPKDAASSYNQGLIEIGALVCNSRRGAEMQGMSFGIAVYYKEKRSLERNSGEISAKA